MDNKKKFLQFSPILQTKESQLKSIYQQQFGAINTIQSHFNFIKNQQKFVDFLRASLDDQRKIFESDSQELLLSIFQILNKASHEKNPAILSLCTLDGILFDNRKNIKQMIRFLKDQSNQSNYITVLFKSLTNQTDLTMLETSVRILSCILSELEYKVYWQQQLEFLSSLMKNNSKPNTLKISDQTLFSCLINLLKIDQLVEGFLENGGIDIIKQVLESNQTELQLMYYTFLVLWLISFNNKSINSFRDPALRIIRQMTEVIQKISREKLIRAAFLCFRNLVEKSPESIELMVDCQILKVIDTIMKGNIKDQDLLDDLEYVGQVLEKNLRILSSFEKYVKEINSEKLEWTPVHTEKFWRENIKKFEEQDFHLIKKLIKLLNKQDDSQTIAVACYDIGEFCRFHTFGKNVLEKLGGKGMILELANSQNQTIRENALLSLQKIMIHNWQMAGGNSVSK